MSGENIPTHTIKSLPKSMIEIRGTIESAVWESTREEAVHELNHSISLDGFRKGKIPETILVQKVGEFTLLEEMAEIAVTRAYASLIGKKELQPIGKPQVTLTKIAKGNPLELTLTTAIFPSFTLPEYVTIAKSIGKEEPILITEKEVEDTITEILRMREHREKEHENKESPSPITELTEETVRQLGNFESVAAFKEALKEQLRAEKQKKESEKRRNLLLEKIAEKTPMDLPDILIDGEIDRMIHQFKGDIANVGGTWDGYLEHAKKKEEDIRKEWREDARRRVTIQIIIDAIATKESLAPTAERIAKDTEEILRVVPDGDPKRAEEYVRFMLTNSLVIEFLEKQSQQKND